MKNRRYFIFILGCFLLSACGQQGPLFMPIENEPIEEGSLENTPIENETIGADPIENGSQEAEIN